jgi:hypothetical protein
MLGRLARVLGTVVLLHLETFRLRREEDELECVRRDPLEFELALKSRKENF